MEPLFFKPIYKNVIWGGDNISRIFNRDIQGNDIGESWELSAHPNGISEIDCSSIDCKNLRDLFTKHKELFGKHCLDMDRFPILIKFIDANSNLSIQVHPDDIYASKHENDSGKTEVWYVMECDDDAKIIYGFKEGINKEEIKDSINNIEEMINYIHVKKGDLISIKPGTIHAITKGIVLCEIQQSSDVTYRLYDWNRVDKNGMPRQLHIKKALDVIDLSNIEEIHNYENLKTNKNIFKYNKFNIDMIYVNEELKDTSNEDSFYAYVVLDGEGSIQTNSITREIKKGTTFMIPSTLGNYSLHGNMRLMKVYI